MSRPHLRASVRTGAGLLIVTVLAACGGGGGGGGSSGGGGGGGTTNSPPAFTASSLTYTVACGGATVTGQVQATDPNGDTLTYGPTNPQPTQGTFNQAVNAAGQFVYKTNPTCTATTDSFGVTVGDGKGGTATASVTVTITPAVNQPPVLTQSSLTGTTSFNTARSGTVLATDPNGDTLTFSFTSTSAKGGTVAGQASGAYTYTPPSGFTGVDTFSVGVSDGRGGVAQGAVSITVSPQAANAPVANDDVFRATITTGQTVTLNVLQNDTNVASPTLTFSGISLPGATVTSSGGNAVLDVGQANFTGFVRFSYTVATGAGQASARAVAFVNTEPVRVVYLSAPSPRDTPGLANEVWTHDFLGSRRIAIVDQGQEVNYRNRPPGLLAAANAPLTPYAVYLASGNGIRDRLFVTRLDLTDPPVQLPLPAGVNVASYAISPNGLYVAFVTCTTATAATACSSASTFNVYVMPVSNLTTLPAPAYTSTSPTQQVDVSFSGSGAFVYLAVTRTTASGPGGGGNYATGAYMRLASATAASPGASPAWTGVFPADPAASVRGFRCVTSRDDATHVCSGNTTVGATADKLWVVRGTPFAAQEISGPLVSDQSVDIRFAVNPQFTWAAYPTNSEPCCTNRRLYVVSVPATQVNPGNATAVDPIPGATRQAIVPITFSKDGTALAVRENQGGPLLTYTGRAASNWTLQPLGPTTAGRISTQPAFAADSQFTYVLDAAANATRGDLLRAVGTGAASKVDTLNGVFVYSPSSIQADRASSRDNGGVLALQADSPALPGTDSIVLVNASTYSGAVTESPASTARTLVLPYFGDYWSAQAARNAP